MLITYQKKNFYAYQLLIVKFGKVIVSLNNAGFWLVTINDDMHVHNLLEVVDVVCFVNFDFCSGIPNLISGCCLLDS